MAPTCQRCTYVLHHEELWRWLYIIKTSNLTVIRQKLFIRGICWMKIEPWVCEMFSENREKWDRDNVFWPLWQGGGNSSDEEQASLYPVKLHSESFQRDWTFLIHIISLIYHQRASEMTRCGPPNLPRRRRSVSQENGAVLLLNWAPEESACVSLQLSNDDSLSYVKMKTCRVYYKIT